MQAFVPKNRRLKFDLHLRIIDLNNVPYVSGRSYVKWHLPSGTLAEGGEHNRRTSKVQIKDHKVLYNYDVTIPLRMTIDKNGMLQDTVMTFDVIHEVSHAEKIHLGCVRLNLAEYVDASEQGVEEEGVLRRYLMQDAKINSTLKIGIYLRQVDGDRNFSAPSLRVAPVFSGIAGLVVGEPEDSEGIAGSSAAPVINSKSQVAGDELRELYRRTIAANWTCLPGELTADKVVEDIFSGGDGWLAKPPSSGNSSGNVKLSDDDGHGNHGHGRHKSSAGEGAGRGSKHAYFTARSIQHIERHSKENLLHVPRVGDRPLAVRGRGSFEQQAHHMGGEAEKGALRDTNEFDELEIREDLRSWKSPS